MHIYFNIINLSFKLKLIFYFSGPLKKLHASGVECYSFTTDGWSTHGASHSLLSLTAHWVEQDFTKKVYSAVCEENGRFTYWECYLCKTWFYAV